MTRNGSAPDLDLGAIAAEHPPRRVVLPWRRLIGDGLISNGDLAYASQLAGIRIDEMAHLNPAALEPAQVELLYRLAWVIALRADPSITWAEARTWQLIVDVGEAETPPDPTRPVVGGRTTT